MCKVTATIDTGSDRFRTGQTGRECARLLRAAANQIEYLGDDFPLYEYPVFDADGLPAQPIRITTAV